MQNIDKFKENCFNKEITTVWSFPERGAWATHNPKYRGNFAPQIARNIILRYSKEGDTVLDPMVGGGTTLIETKLLKRKGIGFDINPEAVEITKNNLKFESKGSLGQHVFLGDARNLYNIPDKSIDLILTHPPYLNIIKYSKNIEGDLSRISSVDKFCNEFESVIKECLRVLKEDSYCAILIGDTRKRQHYVPLSYFIMERFLKSGFILKEDIIKVQHNCNSTPAWKKQLSKYNFLMIMHEHLFVFRKPKDDEDLGIYKDSMIK
jgi:DNA modification methylase